MKKTAKPESFVPFIDAKKSPNGGIDLKPFVRAINKLSSDAELGITFTLKTVGVNVIVTAKKGRKAPVNVVSVANNYAAINRLLGILATLKLATV